MFKFLRDFFSGAREAQGLGFGNPAPKIKWGQIIGHTSKDKGAVGNKTNEYDYNYQVGRLTKLPFATRNTGGVTGAVAALKKIGVNSSIEFHLNAFNSKAKGFEILVLKGDSESARVAELIAMNFKEKYPNRVLRHAKGVKYLSSGDRGYNNLKVAKNNGMKIAILSEPFFIDNPSDFIEPEELAMFWQENLI